MTRLAMLLLLIVLGFYCVPPGLAQEQPEPSIGTDRPTVGTGPDLVAPRFVVVENGTTLTCSGSVKLIDGAENLTRFGMNEWMEFRVQTPSMQWESDRGSFQRQDAAFSAKLHLPSNSKWPIGTIVNLSVPIGSHGVSSGGWDPGILVATSHTLSSRLSFTMSDNLSWVSNGAPGHALISQMSVVPNWKLTGATIAFAEFAPFASRNPGGLGYTADSGLLWTLHDRIQFDVRGGNTCDRNGQSHLLVGAGFSFMVPRR